MFCSIFSSIIEDEHRKKTDLKLEELNQKVNKKWITAQEAKRERLEILNASAEKLGVGIVYRKSSFKGTDMDVTCINNRLMSLTINTALIAQCLRTKCRAHIPNQDGFRRLPRPYSETATTTSN